MTANQSKIEKLIAELCPNGVEFLELGKCSSIKRGKRVTKSELSPEKQYPVYSGGVTPMGYFEEHNQLANTITVVKYGTAGFVNFISEDFWANDVCYCIKPNEILNNKYLFFVLKSKQGFIQSQATNAIPAHLPTEVIESIKIPIPPIAIQDEIVKILDSFTELEAELEAELEVRKKQYEYYRNELLLITNDELRITEKAKWKSLGDIANYSNTRISSNEVNNENYVGVDNLLQNKQGKVISSYVPTSGNLTKYQIGDILIGNIRPYLKKIWKATNTGGTNGDVLVVRINEEAKNKIISEYLYYILSSDSFFDYSMQYAKGAKMPRGDKLAIMKFEIPISSLPEQKRIVSILDKFDALVNDISIGLPAELKARRQQYEYYRGKLLTFKPLSGRI